MSRQENLADENSELKSEIASLQEQIKSNAQQASTPPVTTTVNGSQCPAPVVCPTTISGTVNSIGLSTISLFKPIQGQKIVLALLF